MKAIWTAHTAAAATGGKSTGDWQVARVVIDSRAVRAGDLFVAIKGAVQDGHRYVTEALAAGAAAAMVSRVPDGVLDTSKLLIVPDTLQGLVALGRAARERMRGTVIGITGSVGKTSVKETLALALSPMGKLHVTAGNLNNHIGVPLTLANMPENTMFAVIEMGMNHAGEIRELTKMAKPHLAIITAIQPAHMEFFASVEQVADAKMEIAEGLMEGGKLVLPSDSPYLARMRTRAHALGLSDKKILTVGEAANSTYRLMMYRLQRGISEVMCTLKEKPLTYSFPAIGYHWGSITLFALAVIDILYLDVNKATQALTQCREPQGRGRVSRVPFRQGYITIVDDSYNASPAAMVAALQKLQDVYDAGGQKGRMVAILGDMLELGATATSEHVKLAKTITSLEIQDVWLSGALMRSLHDALPASVNKQWAADAKAVLNIALGRLLADDVVLIKGSHGSHVYEVAAHLLTPKKEAIHAV